MRITLKDKLPCGCRAIGHCQVVGLDGRAVHGVVEADSDLARIVIMRGYLDEVFQRGDVHVRQAEPTFVELVTVECPFELRCRTHGAFS